MSRSGYRCDGVSHHERHIPGGMLHRMTGLVGRHPSAAMEVLLCTVSDSLSTLCLGS